MNIVHCLQDNTLRMSWSKTSAEVKGLGFRILMCGCPARRHTQLSGPQASSRTFWRATTVPASDCMHKAVYRNSFLLFHFDYRYSWIQWRHWLLLAICYQHNLEFNFLINCQKFNPRLCQTRFFSFAGSYKLRITKCIRHHLQSIAFCRVIGMTALNAMRGTDNDIDISACLPPTFG